MNINRIMKQNEKLRDANFRLQYLLMEKNRNTKNPEKEAILQQLVEILSILDPEKEYNTFFNNKKNPSITELLDNFILIIKDKMFRLELAERERNIFGELLD